MHGHSIATPRWTVLRSWINDVIPDRFRLARNQLLEMIGVTPVRTLEMLKRQAHCCRRIRPNDWKDNDHLGCIVYHAVLLRLVVSNTTRQLIYHVILSACPSHDQAALHCHFLGMQRPKVRSPPCRRRGTCLPLLSHETTKAFPVASRLLLLPSRPSANFTSDNNTSRRQHHASRHSSTTAMPTTSKYPHSILR
jgi:hypothetical protein